MVVFSINQTFQIILLTHINLFHPTVFTIHNTNTTAWRTEKRCTVAFPPYYWYNKYTYFQKEIIFILLVTWYTSAECCLCLLLQIMIPTIYKNRIKNVRERHPKAYGAGCFTVTELPKLYCLWFVCALSILYLYLLSLLDTGILLSHWATVHQALLIYLHTLLVLWFYLSIP